MQPNKLKKMSTEKLTTRKQLQGYGTTRYQAEVITKNITSQALQGRTYTYAVSDVIVSIRDYVQRPRIKPATRRTLEAVLPALLERLNNVVEVPFSSVKSPEINKLVRQLTQAMSDTDSALAELKATAATIKAKHDI
ncbi:MAG TPA: hypothetical protein DCE56_00010 [Cyanobacteria bacterium UBA8553]|nr:hypothetical protein [Cyanobacteria bacterium UBA8553]HAJ64884.1 hypothetical protein [Cyanobacteria bacterium UBA8543]